MSPAFRQFFSQILFITSLLCVLVPSAPSFANSTETPPWSQDSREGRFKITLGPQEGSVRINAMQNWVVRIQDRKGVDLSSANVYIDGGMRGHGHGFPTKPQITQYLGEGRYLIEGLRLNMVGAWTLMIGVDYQGQRDSAIFEIEIDY